MTGAERKQCELAIVGGGPAGLAAATLAAQLGLETVLFDEQLAPGGQIYRNVEANSADRGVLGSVLGADYARGLGLVRAFRASGAGFEPTSAVWQVAENGKLGISQGGRAYLTRAARVILATGAMERPVPVPGWTLPGVMGAGAIQTLMKGSGIVPDRPVAIAGSGPLLYLVAFQLAKAGVPLKAVVDTSGRSLVATGRALLPVVPGFASDLGKGLSWIVALRMRRIPIHRGSRLSIEGDTRAEALAFDSGGRRLRIAASLVLLHEGVIPNIQMTTSLRCRHVWDPVQLAWRPGTDDFGATSAPLVAVAGDGAGIGGAGAAVHRGRLAALDAAFRLGRITQDERDARARPEQEALRREARFRSCLDDIYRPAESVRRLDDDTIACRCEEVTAGELRGLIGEGFSDVNQLKSFSRCGMGQCQGRICGTTVGRILAEGLGSGMAEVGHFRLRIPVKPLPLAELARLGNAEPDFRSVQDVAQGSSGGHA